MNLDDAIACLKANGYRVTKPRALPKTIQPRGLNAIGKPYGEGHDPNYRMKYRTPRMPAALSTAGDLCGAHDAYRASMKRKYADNPTLAAEICERNGVAYR